ncbi:GNAT family N-acetyltransferase [Rhodococcus sp. 27YEA15]|uniref:GNAT family N-acetyltransferase n=1 Tax=Rhodococcus sp. 27YEA15 TaxID=3156259 RepID=UPI003C7E34AD
MDHSLGERVGASIVDRTTEVAIVNDTPNASFPAGAILVDNPSHDRFELSAEGDLVGILGYRDEKQDFGAADTDVVAYLHTVVKEEYGGQGMAAVLVTYAMDCARERHWSVRPVCTYVQQYLGKHPEYMDLLVED